MKKDPIDRLFEEKLKDHSEVPDPNVWKAIESSLDNKKKSRKAIPVWWKFAGAAAILLFAMYLLNPIGDTDVPVNSISDSEETAPELPDNMVPPSDDPVIDLQEESTIVTVPVEKDSETPSGIVRTRDGVLIEKSGGNLNSPSGKLPESALAGSENEDNAASGQQVVNGGQEQDNPLAEDAGIPDNATERQSSGNLADSGKSGESREAGDTRNIADGSITNKSPGVDGKSGQDPEKAEAIAEIESEPEGNQFQKKSIYDEIAEMESPEVAENAPSQWSVGPRVAPVYFNSFGQGSPIHSSFVSNSKSGNVNLSYGIALSYSISPKLSVRSGINKVDYGYDTNDISFSPALAVSSNEKINNIDYSLSSRNLIVRNSSEARAAQVALAAEVAAPNPERDGRMVQQFGYIEVPLELNYALVDRKLGIHLIGGLSSLFLVDNSVTLESSGNTTEMGAANNLNSLNFSTNLGVGIQYELSSKLQLNVEPVFKYQLNTFSDAAGSFNPYSIGVYSGLSLKF